ncbi:AAA family ATPase [Streptomyces sp. enrichment culture]|uniref:AAA family ATPase n=1 Tax=Streptomyces sp. enrichment culture TaxID=1795815 RepID=UPI003F544076
MTAQPHAWHVYRGTGEPHDDIDRLPVPPPWRDWEGAGRHEGGGWPRGIVYQTTPEIVDAVNAALYLRRPLLVTGAPGTGKSTLAHHVAHELRLGPVLTWPITSRSTLRDGLYAYDALGRLQETNLRGQAVDHPEDLGRYIRLGPLGTALLSHRVPRVLLIDEIDKGDTDLPNDLLNIFEEGQFEIPELVRHNQEVVEVRDYDGSHTPIRRGSIRARVFPFTVLTSNGERQFPPAFLRRCLRLDLPRPTGDQLLRIVEAHLGRTAVVEGMGLIERFVERQSREALSTDQLLNAVYLLVRDGHDVLPRDEHERDAVLRTVLRRLD